MNSGRLSGSMDDAGFSFIVQEPKEIMDRASETSLRPRRVM